MSYRNRICNLLSSCLAGKDLPPWKRWFIRIDPHESPTPLHCQNPCCIFERGWPPCFSHGTILFPLSPLSPRSTETKWNVGLGLAPTVNHGRKDSLSRDRSFFGSLFSSMSLISRRSSSTSRFFRKTPFILVWMAGRPIFLGFNRTPYERCFYLLLSKNNQVINDWTKPRNNPSRAKL